MEVDAVILARAWFSDSVMNFSLMSGFAASNLLDSARASVICELETMAMVTVLSDAPIEPAPAQPEVKTSPAVAAQAANRCRALRCAFACTSLLTGPTANGHNQCHTPEAGRGCRAARRGWRDAWQLHC